MKILMLTWEYPPRIVGGISRVVYDLSHTLIKDGHDVTVITYKEGDTPYFEDDKGVKVYRVDNYMINPNNFIDWVMQLNFNMVAKANEIIAEEGKFDVVHAHDWLVAYAAKTLKNSYNMPIVATIHATESGRNSGIHDEQQRYINDTEWMLTYEAAEVIVNSNYMKGEIQRLFGLPYDKINVVANDAITKGQIFFTNGLNPTPDTLQVINRTCPTGGVIMPIVIIREKMIPKCTTSIPIAWIRGNMTGSAMIMS